MAWTIRLAHQPDLALSGAGPAVLVIVESEESLQSASAAILSAVGSSQSVKLQKCRFVHAGTSIDTAAGKV